MSATLQELSVEGLTTLTLESEYIRMSILPELGAKVISLQLKVSDREYLWRHPGRSLRRARYADHYERYDISGWDECFPTIAEVIYPEEPWRGAVVPDHGELWTLPWNWEFDAGKLRMWTHSVRFGYCFERIFSLGDAGRIDIAYKVVNPVPFPLKALWSIHPFLKVSPSSRVLLPQGVRVRVDFSKDWRIGAYLTEHPWPIARDSGGREIDLSLMGPPDQQFMEKLFTTRVPDGWAALYDSGDDHFLAFTFSPEDVPFVGICHLRGGWPADDEPSYSTILEPCCGWPDRLDIAMSQGGCMEIPAQGECTWNITLHAGKGREALGRIIDVPLDA